MSSELPTLLDWFRTAMTRRVALLIAGVVTAFVVTLTGAALLPGRVFIALAAWLAISILVTLWTNRAPSDARVWRMNTIMQLVDVAGGLTIAHAIGTIASFIVTAIVLVTIAVTQRGLYQQLVATGAGHVRLIDAAHDIIATLDPSGNFLSVNAAFEQILGWSQANTIGKHFQAYVAAEDHAPAAATFERVLRGETVRIDVRVRTANGRTRTLSAVATPLRDDLGAPHSILAVARDVTAQREESALLAERELQLRLLVQSMNETLFTADTDLRFTAVYGKWEPNTRAAIGDVKGKLPDEVLGRRLGAVFTKHMTSALGGRTVETEDWIRVAGERRTFRLWFTQLKDDAGKVLGVTGVAYDITEQRRMEQERDLLRASLDEARRISSIGRLVSGIAHEINNPLASILTFAEQLRMESRSAVDSAALEAIHAQALRSRAIVRDLLAFVRPPNQRPVTVVRPGPVVSDALKTLTPNVLSFGADLSATISDDAIWIAADVPGLEQAITNVVLNAAQAAGLRGRVVVRTAMSADTFSLIVEDTGRGFSEEALAHLFEPFFTTRAVGEGTGLGLFVSLGIVQRHGGTIRAENRPLREGGGARVTIELPRAAPPPAEPPGKATVNRVTAGPSRRGRVLLIDDEPSIRVSLRRYFTKIGWEVAEAAEGNEALAVLRAEQPETFALILCDLRMPGMGGAELHAHLASEFPSLIDRLVVVSGDVVSPEAAEFIARTGTRLLEKPFELRALGQLAEEMLAAMP